MKIFSGTSCLPLAAKVARELKIKLGDCELSHFPNGESKVWIKEDCKNETVFILQNFCEPVDQTIIQFCLMIDAVARLSPKKIIGVIPWLGYAKQNKVFRPGEPLAAEVVARIVSSSGIDKVFLLDIHNENVKTFFTISVKELTALSLFAEFAKHELLNNKATVSRSNFAVVSPDKGALPRNKYAAKKLGLPLFVIDKERDLATGKIIIKGIADSSGNMLRPTDDILHTNVLMFDDMILSGGTVVKDAQYVASCGAKDIYFFATHCDVNHETFTNLRQAAVKKVVTTNSLVFDIPKSLRYKLQKVNIAKLIAHEIKNY